MQNHEEELKLQVIILTAFLTAVAFLSYTPMIKAQLNWVESPGLAADYSAYYTAAYNLLFNPMRLYFRSSMQNFPVPNAQGFVYPPWFVLFVLPFSTLSFPTSEKVFALFQLCLMPVMAYLVYKLLEPKSELGYLATAFVVEMVMLEPFDSRYVGIDIWPQVLEYAPFFAALAVFPIVAVKAVTERRRWARVLLTLASVTIFVFTAGVPVAHVPRVFPVRSGAMKVGGAYGWQWVLGQSKVLELALILAALVLAKKRPDLSLPMLLLSSFDPRFTLMALPLFVYLVAKGHTTHKLIRGLIYSIVFLVVPFILYHGVLLEYISFVLQGYILAPGGGGSFVFWDYEWLIFYALLATEIVYFAKEFLDRYPAFSKKILRI